MVELYFEKPESRVALKPGALSGIGIKTGGAVLGGRMSVADAFRGVPAAGSPADADSVERARRFVEGIRRR